MPLKVIVTGEQILKARLEHWAEHYERRNFAMVQPPDVCDRVLRACDLLPQPKLNMFGSLDDWNYTAARVISHSTVANALRIAQVPLDVLVKWYWSSFNFEYLGELYRLLPSIDFPQYQMVWKGGDDGIVELIPDSFSVSQSRKPRKVNNALKYGKVHIEFKEKPE